MPDITMCRDAACPFREHCYRFTATPSEHRQSYFAKSPRTGDMCPEAWPNHTRRLSLKVHINEDR